MMRGGRARPMVRAATTVALFCLGLSAVAAAFGQGSQPSPNAASPEVSPDGRTVLAWTGRVTPASAFIMDADGSNRRPISAGRFTSWFPDGRRIVSLKEWGRDDRSIIVLNADRSGETDTGIRGSIAGVRALPDGRFLMAKTVRDTVRRILNWTWFTIRQDGSALTPIAFPVPAGQTVSIGVSPSHDGRRIAFIARRRPGVDGDSVHTANLYVMNLDGTGLRQLATLQGDAGGIAWSADDRMLALADSYVPHPTPAGFIRDAVIVTVDVSSGTVRPLSTHDRRFVDEHPSCGPDGTIYFQTDRDGQMEVYRMNADGTNQRRITQTP